MNQFVLIDTLRGIQLWYTQANVCAWPNRVWAERRALLNQDQSEEAVKSDEVTLAVSKCFKSLGESAEVRTSLSFSRGANYPAAA